MTGRAPVAAPFFIRRALAFFLDRFADNIIVLQSAGVGVYLNKNGDISMIRIMLFIVFCAAGIALSGCSSSPGFAERARGVVTGANPPALTSAQTALEIRQQQEQRLARTATITEQANEIFNAGYDGIVGNPDGEITVVEFFDYNCGFCKRAMADMDEMVRKDPELRFALKEFPILGPDSQRAHIVSMAFRALHPDKYADFHREVLNGPGLAGEEKAMRVAVDLGASEADLRKEMQNPEIQAAFAKTYELANELSITGTPSYVVGDEVVFGALGRAVLTEKVANFRACQSTVC